MKKTSIFVIQKILNSYDYTDESQSKCQFEYELQLGSNSSDNSNKKSIHNRFGFLAAGFVATGCASTAWQLLVLWPSAWQLSIPGHSAVPSLLAACGIFTRFEKKLKFFLDSHRESEDIQDVSKVSSERCM